MNSLYFRLYLWMWINFFILGVAIFLISFSEGLFIDPPFLRKFLDQQLESVGRAAYSLHKNQGVFATKRFLADASPKSNFTWHIVIPETEEFSRKHISKKFHYLLDEIEEESEIELFDGDGWVGAGKKIELENGESFLIVLEGQDMKSVIFATSFPSFLLIRIGSVLIVGGMVCYLFYRRLVAPIRKLESAAKEIASGDLAARVDSEVGSRKDEIGQMASAFNRMADRVETIVGTQHRLLQDVSHELRSPLTRLSLSLDLAESCPQNEIPNRLERMRRETKRLESLIAQFLTLARIDTDPENVPNESVDLIALIDSIVEDAKFESADKRLDFDFHYDQPVYISGNLQLLFSAFENLIRNSIKHSPPDTKLEISIRCTDTEVRTDIKDRGPGVSQEELTSIFEPFYSSIQGNQKSKGVGLGLSITRRVIHQLGGTVFAENRSRGGLVFRVSIPLRKTQKNSTN